MDVAAKMLLLRRQLRSEPEEVNVASGVVAMRRSGLAGSSVVQAECLRYLRRHADQQYSFVDCLSFSVMKDLRITRALTTDLHFRNAGFQLLLKIG
jgi:predicted nucleic acid-binding protein